MITPIKIYLFRDLASYAISNFIDMYKTIDSSEAGLIQIPLPSTNKLKKILREQLSTLPIDFGRSKTLIINTCIPKLNSKIRCLDNMVKPEFCEYKFSINSDTYLIDCVKINNILEQIFCNYAKYTNGTQREFKNKTIQFIQMEKYSAKTIIRTLYDRVISKSLTEIIAQPPSTQILIDNNGMFADNDMDKYIEGDDYSLLSSLIH